MNNTTLNVLLGKTDALASSFKGHLKDYTEFFKKSQGAFHGEKNTYTPNPGTTDEPQKNTKRMIQTTVDEKLDYFIKHQTDYLDCLFSQELTNSSGIATAELIVDGTSWGTFTSLELLRLKSLLEMQDFKLMNESIAVRSDSRVWENNTDDDYVGRKVWQSPIQRWPNRTTHKDSYILIDPNVPVLKDTSKYIPVVANKDVIQDLGIETKQEFTGEWSQRQKAEVLLRISTLRTACIVALKGCNEVKALQSGMTGERILSYLYNR